MDIEKAIMLATRAHLGQKDKGGSPYILHPLKVMSMFEDLPSRIVAVLHDVSEDSGVPVDYIVSECKLNCECREALFLLTKEKGCSYGDYIRKIRDSGNKIAIAVKHMDLLHNSDLRRLNRNPTMEDMRMNDRYLRAINYLNSDIPYFYNSMPESIEPPKYVCFRNANGIPESCLKLVDSRRVGPCTYRKPKHSGDWAIDVVFENDGIFVYEPDESSPAHHLHRHKLYKCSEDEFNKNNHLGSYKFD